MWEQNTRSTVDRDAYWQRGEQEFLWWPAENALVLKIGHKRGLIVATESAPLGKRPTSSRSIRWRAAAWRLFGLLFPGFVLVNCVFRATARGYSTLWFLTPGPTGNVIWKFTLDNLYNPLFTRKIWYVNAYVRSLWIRLVTTVVCLLIALPAGAIYCAALAALAQNLLLFLVLIPFWTDFLVRTTMDDHSGE